jgi:hypothetical protein
MGGDVGAHVGKTQKSETWSTEQTENKLMVKVTLTSGVDSKCLSSRWASL